MQASLVIFTRRWIFPSREIFSLVMGDGARVRVEFVTSFSHRPFYKAHLNKPLWIIWPSMSESGNPSKGTLLLLGLSL